jgi:hypothetical protein
LESSDLLFRKRFIVRAFAFGHGKVGHQTLDPDAFGLPEEIQGRSPLIPGKSQAVQTGVDFQVSGKRIPGFPCPFFDLPGRIQGKKNRSEMILEVHLKFFRVDSTQNQDGEGYVCLAEFDSFLRSGHSQNPDSGRLKLPGYGTGPVAIGIGFDDRQYLRFAPQQIADLPQIVPQGIQIDFSKRRPAHLILLILLAKKSNTFLLLEKINKEEF